MYLKHVITAGILSAALAIGPGAAFAQTSGSTSGTSGTTTSQGTSTTGSSSQGSSGTSSQSGTTATDSSSAQRQNGSGGSGGDQEAVREHLGAAREALAELTKLPAASQLQGEQRQQVAQLIGDFNSFATATTDWRSKYDAIDQELDQILGVGASASASGASAAGSSAPAGSASAPGAPADASAASSPSASGTSGAVGTGGSAAGGALDPTIIAKLTEVRKHLDGFEEASGDPTFVVEKIEKILDQAAGGGASASGAVGTSGTTDSSSASAGGSVTLTAAQVQELRHQLDMIKAAAKR